MARYSFRRVSQNSVLDFATHEKEKVRFFLFSQSNHSPMAPQRLGLAHSRRHWLFLEETSAAGVPPPNLQGW